MFIVKCESVHGPGGGGGVSTAWYLSKLLPTVSLSHRGCRGSCCIPVHVPSPKPANSFWERNAGEMEILLLVLGLPSSATATSAALSKDLDLETGDTLPFGPPPEEEEGLPNDNELMNFTENAPQVVLFPIKVTLLKI